MADNDEKERGPPPDEVAVEVAPHKDYLMLEVRPDNSQFLVHSATLEKVKLPDGWWDLEYDKGFAALVNSQPDEPEVILVEDMLMKVLCKDAKGRYYVHIAGSGGNRAISYSLTEKKSRHEEVSASIRMGATNARCELVLYFLVWPRQSFHFYWSTVGVYKTLALDTYSGQPSKWAWTMWRQSWPTFFEETGLVRDTISGSARNMNDEGGTADPSDYCLPSISISTPALIALLTRWCAATQKSGGFGTADRRKAAEALLAAIVRGACAHGGFSIPLFFDDEWKFKWPIGEDSYHTGRLAVNQQGTVDLGPWKGTVGEPNAATASRWFRTIFGAPAIADGSVSLVKLLGLSVTVGMGGLLRQLVFALAARVELELYGSLKKGAHGENAFRVKTSDMWSVLSNTNRLGHELLKHVAASRRHSAGVNSFSRCADKVVKTFNALVKAAGESKSIFARGIDDRHREYLKRKATTQPSSWRPKKIYRAVSHKFLVHWDNEISTSTCLRGLVDFRYKEDDNAWRPEQALVWKHSISTQDQDSSNLSAMHAALYHFGANTTAIWDWVHGASRCLDYAYDSTGLRKFLMLLLIVANLRHGPVMDEQLRWEQLREVLSWYFENFSSTSSSLFAEHVEALALELSRYHTGGEAPQAAQDIFEYLRENGPYKNRGKRMKSCEFMSMVNGTRTLVKTWRQRLFCCELLALECNFLQGRDFKDKVLVKLKGGDDGNGNVADGAQQIMDASLLRSCCRNAVTITCMVLSVDKHKRLAVLASEVPSAVEHWAMSALKNLKGEGLTLEWVKKQCGGGYSEALRLVFASLADLKLQDQAGFLAFRSNPADDTNGQMYDDEEAAMAHGNLVLSLVSSRVRRCMYFFDGWPGRTFNILLGAEAEARTIKEFKEDWDAFKEFSQAGSFGAEGRRMLSRHPMQCVVNKQWAACFENCGWVGSAEARGLATERASGVMSSIPCETLFNVMKNRRQERGRVKVSVPSKCVGIALASNVAKEVHKFEVLPSDVAVGSQSTKLAKEAFGVGACKTSMPFHGVMGTNASPPYFSPKAENVSQPSADLKMVALAKTDGWEMLERGFFGCFCKWDHMIVFKRDIDGGGRNFEWHCALGHFAGSSAYAWPVRLLPVPHKEGEFEVDFAYGQEHTVLPIVSWDGIVAATFCFHSWNWQQKHFELAAKEWRAATRAFLTSPVMDLRQLAAKSAWWTMDLATLKKLAGGLGMQVGSDKIFETCMRMTMGVLMCDEASAVEIVSKRLPKMLDDDIFTDELMEIEESHNILDRSDANKVEDEKKRSKSSREAYKDFFEDFKKARVKYPAAKAKQAAKRKKKEPEKSYPKLPVNLAMMEQRLAKSFMPEGSHLWKSRNDACWHGKVDGFGEVSRSVRAYGDDLALRYVYQECWRRHLNKAGLDVSACPIEGLF